MKEKEQPQVNDIKILKRTVGSMVYDFEKGDKVQIVGIGDRGYDLKEISSGIVIKECGWDLFEN